MERLGQYMGGGGSENRGALLSRPFKGIQFLFGGV